MSAPGAIDRAERHPTGRVRGFTLIELMIVLVVLVSLLTLGAPAFVQMTAGQRVQTAAADLYTSLMRARSEAIKQNVDVTVAKAGATWMDGWTVSSPAGDVEVHGATTGATIALAGPASIVYHSTGRIAAGATPQFNLSSSTTSTTRCVTIGLSGQPVVKPAACT
jgi:type IV fimbrial biogenesis protein FimT